LKKNRDSIYVESTLCKDLSEIIYAVILLTKMLH
jgi:hypothetical protein